MLGMAPQFVTKFVAMIFHVWSKAVAINLEPNCGAFTCILNLNWVVITNFLDPNCEDVAKNFDPDCGAIDILMIQKLELLPQF